FLHGMTIMGGIGAAALVRVTPTRLGKALITAALAATVVHLGYQTYRANFDPRLIASRANPYVYAHPGRTVREIAERIEGLAAVEGKNMKALIITGKENLWPLPFYLRKVPGAVYSELMPVQTDAPVVVVLSDQTQEAMSHLSGSYV